MCIVSQFGNTLYVKFCIFISGCICLIFYSFATVADPQLEILGHGEYCFYSTDIVTSEYITKTTDLGFSYIYHCDSKNAGKVRKLFDHIDGESITLEGSSVQAVLKKLKGRIVSQSSIGEIQTIYAYILRGNTFIKNGRQKMNLQIANNGTALIAGWPVILGSY